MNDETGRPLHLCYAHGPENNAESRKDVLIRVLGGEWWDDGIRLDTRWFFQSDNWKHLADPLLLFLHHRAVDSFQPKGYNHEYDPWFHFMQAVNSGLTGKEVYVLVVSQEQLVVQEKPVLEWAIKEAEKQNILAGFSVWPRSVWGKKISLLTEPVRRFAEKVRQEKVQFNDFASLMIPPSPWENIDG